METVVCYEGEHTHAKPSGGGGRAETLAPGSTKSFGTRASGDSTATNARRGTTVRRGADVQDECDLTTMNSDFTTSAEEEEEEENLRAGKRRRATPKTPPRAKKIPLEPRSSTTKPKRSASGKSRSGRRLPTTSSGSGQSARERRESSCSAVAAKKPRRAVNPLSPSFAAMGDVLTCFDEYLTASERWSSDYDALALENALIHAHARTRMDDAARVHREAVADRSAPLPRHWFDFMPASPLSPTWPFGDADLEARLLQSSPHPPTAEDRTSAPPRSSLDRRRRDDFPARPPALRVVADDPSARRSPRDDWSIGDLLKSPLEAIVTGTPLLASLSKTVRGWREPSPAPRLRPRVVRAPPFPYSVDVAARVRRRRRHRAVARRLSSHASRPSRAFIAARISSLARTIPSSREDARRRARSAMSAAMALRRFGAGPSAADAAAGASRDAKKPRRRARRRGARRVRGDVQARQSRPADARRRRDGERCAMTKQFDRFDVDATARAANCARAAWTQTRSAQRRGRSRATRASSGYARGVGGSAADERREARASAAARRDARARSR